MSTTHRLSPEAQRTVERTAALRVEFEAMPTAELTLWHSGYSKFVDATLNAEVAERYLEKIHIIACILHERTEAAASLLADVEEFGAEGEIEAEDFDGDAQAAREAANFEAEEEAREVREEKAFEKMVEVFEVKIEDEEIAEAAQQARELAEEEAATNRLRLDREWGLAA